MSWTRLIRKNNRRKYSWRYIERACELISKRVEFLGIDRIIGLSRGGLVPATILANNLHVREVYSIGVASYDKNNTPGNINTYQRLPMNASGFSRGENVLIVDDISDKGDTFKHVYGTTEMQHECMLYTASIFIKPNTKHIPDFYHSQVPEKQWVVFPWERS
jgi:hypoxanthine phosphoribosyltransferase